MRTVVRRWETSMKQIAKKLLSLAMVITLVMALGACGQSDSSETIESTMSSEESKVEETKSAEEEESTSVEVEEPEFEAIGQVVLYGESNEMIGEVECPTRTTLSVDFDAMEAVLKIETDMVVDEEGTVMTFMLVDGVKGDDPMLYYMCAEIGSGSVVQIADNTYSAIWSMTAEDGTVFDLAIDIQADENSNYSAEVAFPGIIGTTVTVTTVES